MSQTKAQLINGKSATIEFTGGSASAPAVSFTGDTNTGIYSPGADQVAISTNGTGRLFINSSGSVGIGSSTPDQRLVAAGGIASTGAGNFGAGNAAGAYLSYEAGGDARLFARSVGAASYLSFWTSTTGGSSEKVRITDTGSVGIGTTSPVSKLHVNLGTNENIVFTTGGGGDQRITAFNDAINATVQLSLQGSPLLFRSTGGVEAGRWDSSGRLLVGTSTARANFYNSTLSAAVQLEGTGNAASARSLSIINNSASNDPPFLLLGKSNGTVLGSNTAVSSSIGQLGIITFQGNDGTEFVSGAEIIAEVDGTSGANDLPTRLVFSTTADGASSPTDRMRILNNGTTDLRATTDVFNVLSNAAAGTTNLLIRGGNSATSFTAYNISFGVYTNGNVVNTNGSYTALSDAKLKENIIDASSQWADLKAIRIRNWNFKPETGNETHRQIGPIAQELEEVCPGLVFETPDRDADGNATGEVTKGVNQSVLYMKAVKALQEAMERIETLEAKIAALESA